MDPRRTREAHAPFAALPVELVQDILGLAAADRPTALTLLSVCHATRNWTLPTAYASIELHSNPAAVLFAQALQSGAAAHVHHLNASVLPGDARLLARALPNVRTLVLARGALAHLPRLHLPSVKDLELRGPLRHAPLAETPLLRGLECLVCRDDVPRLCGASLPRLRTFECCVREKHEELDACLAVILGLPHIEHVGVEVRGAGGTRLSRAEAIEALGAACCARVVVLNPDVPCPKLPSRKPQGRVWRPVKSSW